MQIVPTWFQVLLVGPSSPCSFQSRCDTVPSAEVVEPNRVLPEVTTCDLSSASLQVKPWIVLHTIDELLRSIEMKQNSSVSIESPLPRQIGKLFEEHGSEYVFLNHRPCRSAEESSATRAAAGGKPDVGAKALLCKLQLSTCEEFVVFALPGPARLSSKAIRIALPQLKGLRFATAAELLEITGVVPGALPPF